MSDIVIRQLFLELADEFWAFGAGTDEAHVSFEDVEELWQFVNAQQSQPFADPGHSGIVFLSPDRSVFFGIVAHGAEFIEREFLVVESHACLTEEGRAGGVEFDRNGRGQQKR